MSSLGDPRIMNAVIGTLLFAVAVTLFTWSALQYRQPVLAPWTKNTSAAMVLALASTVSLLLAFAFASQAIFNAVPDEFLTVRVLLSIAAIAGIGVYFMSRFIQQWRSLESNPAASAADFAGGANVSDLTAANDRNAGGGNPTQGSPSGSKPRRRKAA
ncbi:MAG: hypothetical protein O3B08_15650 [Proteobacteria bacterium]|nr:hypothetical protein [Pseudomonadota bacterium]